MKKRILSVLLALCMCLTFVPVSVFAEDLQQDNSISVLSITPDEGTYYTYVFTVDGKEINRQIVKNGDTLLEPKVPAQDGKVFTGWDKTVPFGVIAGLTGENKTIEVKAQFEDGYHVYFKDNNGRIIATKTVKNGTKVTFEGVSFPVGSDEAITGWYEDAGRTKKVDSVTINGADITLYAKVEKGYWLTFESNGGSYVAPAFYAKDTTATAPDEPTKSGYTFAGWYTDKNLMTAANFGNITATTILYAKWREKGNTSYTVIHWLENADDDGYSYEESETKTGTTGGQTNAKAKSYTGFTAQTITQETIKGDGSTIVSVYYKRNVYKVTFYLDDPIYTCGKEAHTHSRLKGCYNLKGELTCKKEEHTHSSACKTETIVIEAKYGANISDQWPTVNGSSTWRTKKNSGPYQVNIATMPLGGTNFYGPKTGNRYETAYYYVEVLPGETGESGPGNLNYKLHHSDTSPGTGYHVTDEDKYPITGFTFKTFSAEWNWGEYNYDQAKFYYTRNSYDLVFISGGKTVMTKPVKYQASIADYANYKPDNAPAGMEDYDFDGWYASKECTGEAYDFTGKTMPAQSITLYAKWVAPTYTVTVYDQDGKEIGKTTVSKGDTVTDWLSTQKNKITLDTGDSFLGWTINRGLPFNPGTKITTNYKLYANVGNNSRYTVTYHSNTTPDATVTDDTMIYAKDVLATVNDNSFSNGDKVFLSWNTRADGKGETYYPNGTIKVTGNMDLYARWGRRSSTVTVTYHSNFGTDRTYVTDAEVNNARITVADYTTLGLPARTGYTFAGWKNNEGTSFSANDSARVNKDDSNDLYAQWTINRYNYTVEYYIDNEKKDSMTETAQADFGDTINSYTDKCPTGYAFDKVDNLPLTIGEDESANVIKVFYKKNVFTLTIHYVYAEGGGQAAEDYTASVTFGDSYSVTSPVIDGYTADKPVVSDNMPANNVEVTVTYTKRSDLSYTVHYYWNGTTTSVKESKTVPGQTFNASVTESPVAVTGCTPVNTDSKTITIDTGKNEITFYYYKNVELTANSKTETYDGTEKSVSGYTGAPEGVTFNGISASGSGTDVGEYNVTFAEGTLNTVDTTNKYIVTKATPGKLTIAKRDVTVTGESATKVYNGQTQEINGYTVDNLVNGHEMTGVTYSAKGKDPGKYDGSFTGSQIVIKDADGNYVTANYNVKTVIGALTITQPSRPTRPSTPTKDVTSVKTADGSQMTLWMSMMLASAAGIVFLGKKRKEEQ